jgi:tight adherence protein C
MDFLYQLVEVQNLVIIAIALLTFLSFFTLVKPLFERDDLKERMRTVALERDKLREKQKEKLNAPRTSRLREENNSLVAELVRALNLHKLLDAESYRSRLRQAGLRREKHMMIFLASRVVLPVVLGIGSYAYLLINYPHVEERLRIATAMAFLVIGFYLPNIYLSNLIQKRREQIRNHWSDALDLMLICVESGMSIEMALQRVAKEIGAVCPPLAEELMLTNAELSYLGDRTKALENLAERTGLQSVKSVVSALIQAERYGTPLGQALRVLARENRDERMAEIEKKAAALPPKLTVPMVGFFLPVIFIVLLGPAAIMVFGLK